MNVIICGESVARLYENNFDACFQDYQPGCGSYCNCDCNGDH